MTAIPTDTGPPVRADRPSTERDEKTGLTEGQASFAYLYSLGSGRIAGNVRMSYALAYRWIDDVEGFAGLDAKQRARAQTLGTVMLKRPKVKAAVHRYQTELAIETDQSRATWIARAVEMREEAMRTGKVQAAAKIHRDIGDALGHFTTKIEVSTTPRTGDIVSRIASLLKDNPQLMAKTMQQLRGVDLGKMVESTSKPSRQSSVGVEVEPADPGYDFEPSEVVDLPPIPE